MEKKLGPLYIKLFAKAIRSVKNKYLDVTIQINTSQIVPYISPIWHTKQRLIWLDAKVADLEGDPQSFPFSNQAKNEATKAKFNEIKTGGITHYSQQVPANIMQTFMG